MFFKKWFDIFSKKRIIPLTHDCGEMAEQAEGAPLLREYGVKKLHRGFESLSHRHCLFYLFCTRSSAG